MGWDRIPSGEPHADVCEQDSGLDPIREMAGALMNFPVLRAFFLLAVFCWGSPLRGQAPAGKTRVYYVAADEVNWDYAPTGRDEAMGHSFDALQKGFTDSG